MDADGAEAELGALGSDSVMEEEADEENDMAEPVVKITVDKSGEK